MIAVLDRIVDGSKAVLLVGDQEKEYVVPITTLPIGVHVGDKLDVTINGNQIVEVMLKQKETKQTQDRIAEKMEQLQSKKQSQFKKS